MVPVEELTPEDLEVLEEEDFLWVENKPRYARHQAPLAKGRYMPVDACQEHIGSYVYYATWRDWLARAFFNAPWSELGPDHPDAGGAFWDLLTFSDCQGFLGSAAVRTRHRL
jgi:hypothetical protein